MGFILSQKFKTKFLLNALMIFIALFLLLLNEQCTNQDSIQRLNKNIVNLGLENQTFKTEKTKTSELISSQAQIILTQKEAMNNGVIELKRVKKLKSKVRIVSETRIDTVFVPFTEELVVNEDGNTETVFKFDYKEPKDWYSLNGYVNSKGLGIDNLTVKNDYTIYIADTKMGMFKKTVPEVLLVNKNPYTETINMNNIVIIYEKPFYKKNGFWFGVGVVGGILIAK